MDDRAVIIRDPGATTSGAAAAKTKMTDHMTDMGVTTGWTSLSPWRSIARVVETVAKKY